MVGPRDVKGLFTLLFKECRWIPVERMRLGAFFVGLLCKMIGFDGYLTGETTVEDDTFVKEYDIDVFRGLLIAGFKEVPDVGRKGLAKLLFKASGVGLL
jgi:hypothetical protein